MDRRSFALGMILTTFFLGACTVNDPKLPLPAEIDAEARRLMASEDVKGMAIAVIRNGRVEHVAAYGHRNIEKNLPLTVDTIMYGASLTKAAVGYVALMLAQDGKLNLDASVEALLPKPLPDYEGYADLKDDDRWKLLTPRILLNHTTGFANFRWLEPDERLRFHHKPGTRYGYSGEGINILQMVIEQGLGLELGSLMQDRLFQPLGMTRTSMMWRPDFAENLADGYTIDGSFEPHDERSRPKAAGSMDTTIADQARLWAALVRGDLLNKERRAEFSRNQFSIESAHQFPTLEPATDPRNEQIRLGAGVGVVVFQDRSGPAFFKGGHNDSTANMVVCQESKRDCIVLLSNSVRAELIYPELIRFVLGENDMPWRWEYNYPDSPQKN